jgi:hypothetical protein
MPFTPGVCYGVAPVLLTDAATIATNAALGNVFYVTLTDNRTLGNPTNLIEGATYQWFIIQDAGGTNTLDYGNLFAWPAGTEPVLTVTGNAVDIITSTYCGGLLHSVFSADSKVP